MWDRRTAIDTYQSMSVKEGWLYKQKNKRKQQLFGNQTQPQQLVKRWFCLSEEMLLYKHSPRSKSVKKKFVIGKNRTIRIDRRSSTCITLALPERTLTLVAIDTNDASAWHAALQRCAYMHKSTHHSAHRRSPDDYSPLAATRSHPTTASVSGQAASSTSSEDKDPRKLLAKPSSVKEHFGVSVSRTSAATCERDAHPEAAIDPDGAAAAAAAATNAVSHYDNHYESCTSMPQQSNQAVDGLEDDVGALFQAEHNAANAAAASVVRWPSKNNSTGNESSVTTGDADETKQSGAVSEVGKHLDIVDWDEWDSSSDDAHEDFSDV